MLNSHRKSFVRVLAALFFLTISLINALKMSTKPEHNSQIWYFNAEKMEKMYEVAVLDGYESCCTRPHLNGVLWQCAY